MYVAFDMFWNSGTTNGTRDEVAVNIFIAIVVIESSDNVMGPRNSKDASGRRC
jgi:hypothetical protein